MNAVDRDVDIPISFRQDVTDSLPGTSEAPGVERSRWRWRARWRVYSAIFQTAALAVALVTTPTPSLAATGCDSLWAQTYAEAHGFADCDVLTVACDSDEDGVEDDFCTVNELLDEFHADPLRGERVDTDSDGIVDAYPEDVVPNLGDGNMNTVTVPLCADGSDICPGEELRCVDGTRPVYYVDPADDLDATRWLFTFQGGGSCGANTNATGGEDCWNKYQDQDGREQMSTAALAGTTVKGQKRSLIVGGILDDRASNDFSAFHRVKIDKCSFDRSTGHITRTDLAGPGRGLDASTLSGKPENADGLAFDLSFHGGLIVEAVLEDLRTGKTVPVHADATNVALPWLEAADLVLLAGHSGGSVGLTSRVDRTAAHMAAWGSAAEVLALFDARGKPGIDHESSRSFGIAGENMYDFSTGAAACDAATETCLPAHGATPESSYDDSHYDGGGNAIQFAYWDRRADDSCASWHPGADGWRCLDATHVLYNHVETPFFMRQAQRDKNHLSHGPEFALTDGYRFSDIQYRRRAVGQAVSMRDERDKPFVFRDWDERVYGWAQPADKGLGLFMPNVTKHAGLFNNEQFFSTYLEDAAGVTCLSYHDALWSWLDGGGEAFWVDGVDGVVSAASCP